jgi:hypothetical protein
MHAAAPTSSGPKGRVSTSRRRSAKRRSAGCRAVACIRFGAAHAPSPDVRFGHPGLRSLDADCAPASCLRWSATPALGAWAAPHGCFRVPCKPDAPSHTSPTRPPIQARRALPYKPDARARVEGAVGGGFPCLRCGLGWRRNRQDALVAPPPRCRAGCPARASDRRSPSENRQDADVSRVVSPAGRATAGCGRRDATRGGCCIARPRCR